MIDVFRYIRVPRSVHDLHDRNRCPEDDLKTVSFDFDGVLAQPIWPEMGIGEPIQMGLDLLAAYWGHGCRIIVFTSRHWADYEMIRGWLEFRVPGMVDQVICGKPLASLYIDDRAVKFPLEEIDAL